MCRLPETVGCSGWCPGPQADAVDSCSAVRRTGRIVRTGLTANAKLTALAGLRARSREMRETRSPDTKSTATTLPKAMADALTLAPLPIVPAGKITGLQICLARMATAVGISAPLKLTTTPVYARPWEERRYATFLQPALVHALYSRHCISLAFQSLV